MAIIGGKKENHSQIPPEKFQNNDLRFGTIITYDGGKYPYKNFVSWGDDGIRYPIEDCKIRILCSGIYRKFYNGKKFEYDAYTPNTPIHQECYRSVIIIHNEITNALVPMVCDFDSTMINIVNFWEDQNCDEKGTYIRFKLKEYDAGGKGKTKLYPSEISKEIFHVDPSRIDPQTEIEIKACLKWLKKNISDMQIESESEQVPY